MLVLVTAEILIHGTLKTLGTVTGRTATQQTFNKFLQTLKQDLCGFCQEYGIGADLSGLASSSSSLHVSCRCGEYANEILNGDIHTTNQNAAGLETRNQAKTFIYH